MKDAAGLLGLCTRARKIATGETIYRKFQSRQIHLLILANDIGDNSKKKLTDKCNFYHVEYVYMDASAMNTAIGDCNRKAIAILDKGFAMQMIACLKG